MNTPPQKEKSGGRRHFIRKLVLVSICLCVFVAGAWWFAKQKAAHERARWKRTAIERLAGLSPNNEEIRREIEALKTGLKRGWTHDHVLMMKNGEHIIYAYRHGRNSSFDHLFLGHGSDGRWLHSSYHFCNSMVMLNSDDAPGSITEFAQSYSAREFDGKSDECLQRTWNGTFSRMNRSNANRDE